MRAKVDMGGCIGCGLCEQLAPEVFQLTESGVADTICDEIPHEIEGTAQEARDSCPVSVISLEE